MEIYIKDLTKITQDKSSVGYVHYMPFDENYGLQKTREELEQSGILVELPSEELPKVEGMKCELFYNATTNELFYDYAKENISKEISLQDVNDKLDLILQANLESEGIL